MLENCLLTLCSTRSGASLEGGGRELWRLRGREGGGKECSIEGCGVKGGGSIVEGTRGGGV